MYWQFTPSVCPSTRPGRRRGWLNFAVAAAAGDRNDYTLFVDVLRSPRVRSDAGQMGAVTPPSRTNNRPQLQFLTGFTSVSGCSAGQSAARVLHVEAVSSPYGFLSILTPQRGEMQEMIVQSAYVKERCAGSAIPARLPVTHHFRRASPLDVPVFDPRSLQSSNMVYIHKHAPAPPVDGLRRDNASSFGRPSPDARRARYC